MSELATPLPRLTRWVWGVAGATVVIAVGFDRSELSGFFGSVVRAGSITLGVPVHNDENGQPIWICRTPRGSWSVLWPQFRHY